MIDDVIFLSSKNPFTRFNKIRETINITKADIIWTWGSVEATYGVILSVISKRQHINGCVRHGIIRFNRHHLWRFLILHISKNIVANSYAGIVANKIKKGFVLYNGIDRNFLMKPEKERSSIRREFGINDEIILLSSIANLVPYKDYGTILKALRIVKNRRIQFYYIAIGEGKERLRIDGLIESLNLSENVTFLGMRNDIKEVLYASDIFIHSSRGEGCSNAILEAMAVGLPIIASNTGGTSEIVDENVGRLFEFKNAEQLANLIMDLISNKPERERLAINSKSRALSDFSIERMMSNYYRIIEEIMK